MDRFAAPIALALAVMLGGAGGFEEGVREAKARRTRAKSTSKED